MDATPIHIAVINDYEVVVRGVAAMLADEPDIHVAATAVGDLDVPPVDIALYDTFGAADPTLTDVEKLLARRSIEHVAVYTSTFTDAAVKRAIDLGVHGYLPKALEARELADALRRIAAGDTVVVDPPRSKRRGGLWPGEDHGLTEKESDVLALIVRGLDNRAIADALYISPDTLKSRIRTLYRRIGAGNRVDAVLWGVDHGFRPTGSDPADLTLI